MALAVAHPSSDDVMAELEAIGRRARAAERALAHLPADRRTAGLTAAAARLRAAQAAILAANARDLDDHPNLTAALRDRLLLDAERVAAMADGVETVARLP